MKKILILLALVFLITGCSVYRVDDSNIDMMIDKSLKESNTLYNQNFSGYKFYLPKGVTILDKNGYNFKLLSNGNKMFMFVDVIAYHDKVKTDYELNENAYYSQLFSGEDKNGYIEIEKIDDKYLIEFVYNYAKIEAYVDKKDLSSTLLRISKILNSFQYNYKIIDSLIGEDRISYTEEEYTFFKTDDDSNYLQAKNDEKKDNVEEITDDENIEIDESQFD